MSNDLGIIAEMFFSVGIPILIPFSIICISSYIKYNEKIKTKILTALALIYNFIVGFYSFLIMFVATAKITAIINDKSFMSMFIIILLFAILIVPINIYVMKKITINKIIYTFLNIFMFIMGFIIYVILLRSNVVNFL